MVVEIIRKGKEMNEYLDFRKMVSKSMVKFIYILGVVVLTISGLVMFFQGAGAFFIGLTLIIFGNLLWRVLCEGWIIIFSIHDILGSIDKSLSKNE